MFTKSYKKAVITNVGMFSCYQWGIGPIRCKSDLWKDENPQTTRIINFVY